MIFFVAGATCSGKTSLVKKITSSNEIEVVSTDTIKDVLQSEKPESPDLNTNSYRAWQDLGLGESNVYQGAIIHSRVLWNAVNHIATKNLNRNEDLIIEGSHLLPEFFDEYEFPEQRVIAILLAPTYNVHQQRAKMRNATRSRNTEESRTINSCTMFGFSWQIQEKMVSGYDRHADKMTVLRLSSESPFEELLRLSDVFTK